MRFVPLFLLLMAFFGMDAATPFGTVQPQNTPPTITCPDNATVSTDVFGCTTVFDYNVQANDDQPGWSLTQTAGSPSGATLGVGTVVNQFTVTDSDNNTATCSFTVTVIDDIPPSAACPDIVQVLPPIMDDPNDCYDGAVAQIPASAFDDGSYDNCGNPLLVTISRVAPYSDCISGLNQINGQSPCNDASPDTPSEFERAISEAAFLKLYCCEAGTTQVLLVRVYQTTSGGGIALDANGNPIYNECLTTLIMEAGACEENAARVAIDLVQDTDGNCQPDADQTGLSGQVVKISNPSGQHLYTSIAPNGQNLLPNVNAGQQQIQVLSPLAGWEPCNPTTDVNVAAGPSETNVQILAKPAVDCPLMQVQVSAGALTACSNSRWTAQYCNLGGATATDAYVDLQISENFNWISASQPYTIAGNTMRVLIGDVPAGQCGTFEALLATPCGANAVGTRLRLDAQVYPDNICLPASSSWSGAQIEVSSECIGDSIRFTLRNSGITPTSTALPYVIIDDMVIMYEKTIPAGLQPGATLTETVKAESQAYRLSATQEPGHPGLRQPSVLAHTCGNTNGSLLLEFANASGNLFTDTECRVVTDGTSANTLHAQPLGYAAARFIEPNTALTYQVQFQNIVSPNVQHAVLRDTLSALLDPATLRITGASHPHTYTVDQNGVLEVRFANIQLPSAFEDEAASRGFIQFDVQQKANNQPGAIIENEATVYFDIVPGIKTDKVWHTIGTDFIPVVGTQQPNWIAEARIYPNPAETSTVIDFGKEVNGQVRVLDFSGREMQRYQANGVTLQVQRKNLPAGMYRVELEQAGRWLPAGKLIWNP